MESNSAVNMLGPLLNVIELEKKCSEIEDKIHALPFNNYSERQCLENELKYMKRLFEKAEQEFENSIERFCLP